MNQTTAIPSHRPVGRKRGHYRLLALAVPLALIIGAIGLAIETPIKLARASSANETAVAVPPPTYPIREIPAEWSGHREPVKYKKMYRTDPTPKLDWIR
jgi:hypothetical protein